MVKTPLDDAEIDPAMLLSGIGRVLARRLTDLLEPTGLKPRHMGVMVALRSGSLPQQMLTAALAMHPAKIVALLNDLEVDGLIVRRRDTDDRRRHTVSLSELGKARMAAVDMAREKLDAQLFADVTPAKRALLVSLLITVAENLGITPCHEVAPEEGTCPT